MKKQIVTIVLGAVAMLGTATTLFAQNGLPTGGYPPVMGGAGGNPQYPDQATFPKEDQATSLLELRIISRSSTTEGFTCQQSTKRMATNSSNPIGRSRIA